MNDRSSVSHDYSSKSAERLLLCVTAKIARPMSDLGQTRTSEHFRHMSA
jgi:hypothetical protein